MDKSSKKLLLSVALVSALFAMLPTQAGAATVTFNGADIVAPYALPVVTVGTPKVGDGYINTIATGAIRTYNNGINTPAPTAFNDWLASLGTGEGLSGFNLWLMDGLSDQAAQWGETLALTDAKTAAGNIHPFASSGWTAFVYTLGDEWGPTWSGGEMISFSAISSADYLRPGTTATFGFTADVSGFNGGTGPDYQIWVGAGNASNSDNGTNQLAGVDGGIYFQRAITAAVPEPETYAMMLAGLGLMGFIARRRKQKLAA